MKIKNIAFFGVMASIFGIAGAEAADSTPTKIATTAYVTNAVTTHANDTVKHITAAERTAWNAKQNAISSNSLNGSVLVDSSVTKAKLESTVQSSLGKADSALQSNSALNGANLTAGTVAKTALAATVQTSLGKADTALQSSSALNGANLTAGTVAKTALAAGVQTSLGLADSAVQPAAIANMEVKTNKKNATTAAAWNSAVSATTAETDYPTVTAVATALGTKQDTIADGGLSGAKLTDGTVTKGKLATAVQSSLNLADSALQSTSTLNGAKLSSGSVAKTALATTVQSSLDKADSALQSTSALNGANLTAGTVAKTALAAGVQSSLDKADSALQASAIHDGTISTTSTTTAPSEKSVATALGTKVTANSSITGATKTKITYDSKGLVTGGADLTASDIPTLDYTKMNAALTDINGTTGWSAASDCSASTPCVLTYVGSNTYKWTVMDIPAAN